MVFFERENIYIYIYIYTHTHNVEQLKNCQKNIIDQKFRNVFFKRKKSQYVFGIKYSKAKH